MHVFCEVRFSWECVCAKLQHPFRAFGMYRRKAWLSSAIMRGSVGYAYKICLLLHNPPDCICEWLGMLPVNLPCVCVCVSWCYKSEEALVLVCSCLVCFTFDFIWFCKLLLIHIRTWDDSGRIGVAQCVLNHIRSHIHTQLHFNCTHDQ